MTARRHLHAVREPIEAAIPSDEPADFREYLYEMGLSDKTVALYVRVMLRVDAFCEQRGHRLAAAPGPLIAEFAETLPRSRSTRHHLRASLRHFWTWQDRQRPPLWAVKVPKARRMVCRALEPDDAVRLAKLATERGDRRGLAVLVGLYEALRVSEIAALGWGDLDEPGWLKVVGKGDVEARIPLHPALAAALATYKDEHGGSGPWVFPGRAHGEHVHPSTIWGWAKGLAAEVGVVNMTTHQLRHTALAEALDATKDLRAVRDFARHAKVSTTEGYTRTTVERLRAVSAAIEYGEAAPSVEQVAKLADEADWYDSILGDAPEDLAVGGWHDRFRAAAERLSQTAAGDAALLRLAAGPAEPEDAWRPGRGLLIAAALRAERP